LQQQLQQESLDGETLPAEGEQCSCAIHPLTFGIAGLAGQIWCTAGVLGTISRCIKVVMMDIVTR
jgi:hypothetical protein